MNYQITVVKMEKNPNFEAELAKWKEENSRGYGIKGYNNGEIIQMYPQETFPKNTLMVELTEEEYAKVKEAVISTFK